MSTPAPRFHERLLGKLLLLVLLPTVLVVLAIGAVNGYRTWVLAEAALLGELEGAAKLAVETVEVENNKAASLARTMAIAQTSGLFGERERTLEMCRDLLLANPDINGAFVVYEVDADVADSAGLEGAMPREAMTETGRFVPYYRRNSAAPGGIELIPNVNMEDAESLWYRGVKEAFLRTRRPAPMTTRPYLYEGVELIEHTYPIIIDGAFKGVAGVDRALAQVQAELVSIRERTGVDILLETRGRFIAATVDAQRGPNSARLQATEVKDSPFASLFASRSASGDTVEIFEAIDPQSGEDCFYAIAQVPTGEWTLIARKPKSELFAALFSMTWANLVTAIIGLLIVAAVIVLFALALRRRVGSAVEAAQRIADGDLTQEIVEDRARDETGDLVRGLRRMTDNLNRLVGKVQQASIQINTTANELAATSRQQQQSVGAFGASTSQIAAAVREISATTEELVRTMAAVDEGGRETARLAESGRTGLERMDHSMRHLQEATRSIGQRLSSISEKASNITSIITTITKVADQTNLLSVNAAIEAEKAGEYGAGFLVVAREIRRLADQAAGATLDIERMIAQMQSAVSSGVMEMDRFAEAVRSGVEEVGRISSQFSQIIEQVEQGSESFRAVNEGMKSQSEGARQISEAMTTLTGGARQTAEAASDFAQAAQDLQGAIADLKSAIAIFRLRSTA